jgi:hypothetical protein
MAKTVEKIIDLEFDELTTLALIEQNDDLLSIFTDEVKIPFSVLYTLQKENKLSEDTKILIETLFDKIILTSRNLVEKYLRLSNKDFTELKKLDEENVGVILEEINLGSTNDNTIINEEPINVAINNKVSNKKETVIPRRYGKEKITKDIEAQGGVATPVQRAMLKVNDLKNIYVNLSTRGIKDMVANTDSLSDEDCRKIVSAITTFERQMAEIVKTKAKKK